MDETSSPRRKSTNHSPRPTPSAGYTSDDERSSSKYIHENLLIEFTTNLDRFITAYITKDVYEIVNCTEIVSKQIAAFKALERSIYGELFIKYQIQPEEDTLMRSFYVGCLYQVIHPQIIFNLKHS